MATKVPLRLFRWLSVSLLFIIYLPMISNNASAAGVPSKIKGMSFSSWTTTGFNTSGAQQSFKNLTADLPNCVAIVFTWYQDNISSTTIYRTGNTESDSDLIYAIQEAHNAGKCVMLKPHLDLRYDTSHWRGQIGQNFSSSQWSSWFTSYRNMIYHYASLAKQYGVEMICIGTELVTSSLNQPSNWRSTVDGIRSRYSGLLTYSANHDGEEQSITWWDKLDFIGISAYYSLTNHSNPTLTELLNAWAPRVSMLSSLASKWGKSIIFTEIGYRSIAGTNTQPWNSWMTGSADLSEQNNCYQALFQSFWGQSWFKGIFWWFWDINPNTGGSNDTNYTPKGKPAESTLKSWFSK